MQSLGCQTSISIPYNKRKTESQVTDTITEKEEIKKKHKINGFSRKRFDIIIKKKIM